MPTPLEQAQAYLAANAAESGADEVIRILVEELQRLIFQNSNLLDINAKERSYNAGWAEKWHSALCERDLFKSRWEHSEELRTSLVDQLHKALRYAPTH